MFIKDHIWETAIDQKRKVARMRLPSQSKTIIRGISLAAKTAYPAVFIIEGVNELSKRTHSLAIRQLYNGFDVGSLSWDFSFQQQVQIQEN